MRFEKLSSWMLALTLVAPLGACDEEDDGGDDSAGDSANGSEGGEAGEAGEGGEAGEEGGGMTSSSEETCQSSHACINDVCTCQTPGLEDMECTDDEACEEECEICM